MTKHSMRRKDKDPLTVYVKGSKVYQYPTGEDDQLLGNIIGGVVCLFTEDKWVTLGTITYCN